MPDISPENTLEFGDAPFRIVSGRTQLPESQRLLRLRYGEGPRPSAPATTATLDIGMRCLSDHGEESIVANVAVETGERDGVHYSSSPDVLVAWTEITEDSRSDVAESAYRAYRRLLNFQNQHDYPHILRVWNLFTDINCGDGDQERYRQFCIGRARALNDAGALEQPFPAATCVGTHAGPVLLYWLAARSAGAQIENPRQVSAFHYPPRYGPVSPSFSRATLKHWSNETHLYISGTASVVGHESRHPGDVIAQLDESLRNVEALLLQATAASAALKGGSIQDLAQLKVYLRRPADLVPVRDALRHKLGDSPVPCLFLEADICREELLLEVEALCVQKRHAL